MILELIGNFMIGAGASLGTQFLLKKRAARVDAHGALPWSIYKRQNGRHGFKCPKCINIHCNTAQPDLCSCLEYPRDHFHFKCGDCGFKSLLRTADDKE